MKFESSGSKGTRVIERKRSVTDGQTDKAKTMSPPEGGGRDITNRRDNILLKFVNNLST